MTTAGPFLKWAGGKRWLAPLVALSYRDGGTYVEPFLGGGAMFFALKPRTAVLADSNFELVETYRAVRDDPAAVIESLGALSVDVDTFLQVRAWAPTDAVGRATRLIYLNRTAYNGLYRVNRSGQFNVPFGCKPGTTPVDKRAIEASSRALRGVEIVCQDYLDTLIRCGLGDFVYLDPPYSTRSSRDSFARYTCRAFTWDDQQRMATEAHRLAALGATVVVSNVDIPDVVDLYDADVFSMVRFDRRRRMAASVTHRRAASELVMVANSRLVLKEGDEPLSASR